ncbi:MAG: peptidoglycan-binding domain-containing protein [Burkholderiales bacterium]
MMMDLSIGAMGSDVTRNQYALNLAGKSRLPQLETDGLFGPKTRARVMEFQRNNGLIADGVIGRLTRTKLGTSDPMTDAPATSVGGRQTELDLARSIALAVKAGINHWQAQARFVGVTIHGAFATGAPGCLVGPAIFGPMSAWLGSIKGEDNAIAQAVGKAIANAFQRWQKSVAITGMNWYPGFAAFPGPVAPPTPNVPCPLIALKSNTNELMYEASLLQVLKQGATGSPSPRAAAVHAALAEPLARAFLMYMTMTMVIGVMGQGRVPTFAPPTARAGPVVGGSVIPAPGVLSGPGFAAFF